MEKFIYFRQTSGVSGDQDETSGSVMYPLSHFKGMVAGDATDATGDITDDDDRFTMFFLPMSATATTGAALDATDDDMDVVVFDVTSGDFDFKALYEEFAGLVNGTHSSGMVTIFDGLTSTGITGITAVHQVTKVSSD